MKTLSAFLFSKERNCSREAEITLTSCDKNIPTLGFVSKISLSIPKSRNPFLSIETF